MSDFNSEETPLLKDAQKKHAEVYQRFSPAKKKTILAMVSFSGLLPLFVTGTFIPLIPQVAADLRSTPAVVSLAVSTAIFATSIGSMFGSSYSTYYGRRPIYLIGTPLLIIASVAGAAAQSIPQLLFWRFLQSVGASPGLTIGAAVIGDIYKLDERGTAMGIFYGSILLGPTLAPLAGGLAAHYSSWRIMQLSVGAFTLMVFIFMFLFFPETYHPGERGVDKVVQGNHATCQWRPVLLNPFRPLWLLRSPNLLFVTFAGFSAILTDYVLLVPIAYTLGTRYGIKNEALIGACFLPAGMGNILGATYAGHLSDKLVKKWRAKRNGEWYAEDRLRATFPGAVIFAPLSVLLSGVVTTYIPGPVGLVLNLFFLFVNGIGVDFVLGPSAAYFVDSMHTRSAEAIAAYTGFRQVLTGLATSLIVPMIEKYDVLATNAATALLAWIGCLLLWITVKYGAQLRAFVDVGFSTSHNN